jgi:hypothetical protein
MAQSRIIVPAIALLVAFIVGLYKVPDLIILFVVVAVILFMTVKHYWFDKEGSDDKK